MREIIKLADQDFISNIVRLINMIKVYIKYLKVNINKMREEELFKKKSNRTRRDNTIQKCKKKKNPCPYLQDLQQIKNVEEKSVILKHSHKNNPK